MGSDFSGLKASIAALREEIKTLKSTIVNQPASEGNLLDAEKIINEISERDKRRCNVVIYGCRETVTSSNKDQLALDCTFVAELCASLQLNESGLMPARLGKFDASQTNRRRPIKITLASETAVFTALRNFKKIRTDSRYKGLSMFRDRTPMQMQIHRNARNELADRLKNGESNLMIKYRNGIPHIVSSLN